ncbi:MAG: GUN4 domain-containing protein [Microcystis aeruginosa WS75]|nr:GUN4 domain-containing protein [Microcystis aeruginosa WS75]
MDYTTLRELLQQKKWQEADQKTRDLMLTAANRQKEEWLDIESVNKFSCEDLRMIDREWLNASGGKFGFSVQLAIYKQTGNTPGSDNFAAYERFGDAVGWRKDEEWQYYGNLIWSTNAPAIAPKGHLPVGAVGITDAFDRLWRGWKAQVVWSGNLLSSLPSRCGL